MPPKKKPAGSVKKKEGIKKKKKSLENEETDDVAGTPVVEEEKKKKKAPVKKKPASTKQVVGKPKSSKTLKPKSAKQLNTTKKKAATLASPATDVKKPASVGTLTSPLLTTPQTKKKAAIPKINSPVAKMAAPSRPQSMRRLPGGGGGGGVQSVPQKPQSQKRMGLASSSPKISGNRGDSRSFRYNGNSPNSSVPPGSMRQLNGGRGRGRGQGRGRGRMSGRVGPSKMGKNARSNRMLPPPPGSRGLFSTSSHHKPPSSSMSSRFLSSSTSRSFEFNNDDESDPSDDDDEFAVDLADPASTRPGSILRKSTGRGSRKKRINADGSISASDSALFSMDETSEIEHFSDEGASEREPMVNRLPMRNKRLKKPGLGINESEHSLRGWTQSFNWGRHKNSGPADRQTRANGDQMTVSKSVRSLLTVDLEFEDEPLWKTILRYIRILAPHPDEKPIKRQIRIFTWISLVLDFMTGLVSLVTFDDVTYCCEEAILSIAGDINWYAAIRATVYLYMIMIFAEIIPVMREAFPFNLANPFIGFLITFGMFFDDRILEAAIMWAIEASAVLCEFWVYRLKIKWHNQRGARLKSAEGDLIAIRKERKRRKLSASSHSMDSVSSDISLEDNSFHDESEMGSMSQIEAPRPKDISQIRETRLLRERRLLRQAQSDDQRNLKIFFGGLAFNIALVCISLLLIVMVGKSGGLCIVDMTAPNVFKGGQLDKCFDCKGVEGVCQICRDDETSHCYYPYY